MKTSIKYRVSFINGSVELVTRTTKDAEEAIEMAHSYRHQSPRIEKGDRYGVWVRDAELQARFELLMSEL